MCVQTKTKQPSVSHDTVTKINKSAVATKKRAEKPSKILLNCKQNVRADHFSTSSINHNLFKEMNRPNFTINLQHKTTAKSTMQKTESNKEIKSKSERLLASGSSGKAKDLKTSSASEKFHRREVLCKASAHNQTREEQVWDRRHPWQQKKKELKRKKRKRVAWKSHGAPSTSSSPHGGPSSKFVFETPWTITQSSKMKESFWVSTKMAALSAKTFINFANLAKSQSRG